MADPMATICELKAEDFAAWDEFVLEHPQGSPFHLIAWKKTIEEAFGYEPVYLAAKTGSQIEGVLPLFFVRNPIIGRVLVSSPFAVYGGILAESSAAGQLLYDHANWLGRKRSADYLELRNAYPEQCLGEPNVSRYVTFVRDVVPNEEALFSSLSPKIRNKVRKAMKQQFTIRYRVEDAKTLDRVHSRNMRRLGTPCFPREYFARLQANFREMVDVREVRLGDEAVAVSLSFLFRDQMHTYHSAADTRYNALAPNTLLYYDHLRWAGQHGFRQFDFGRSKRNTGAFEFKKHWNTTMRELPYEIVLLKRRDLPNFSPANPRFRAAIRVWQNLPLPVTRVMSRFVLPLFP
jgi:FemAB-related protein (PEP-CTERM system-associated)